MLRKVMNPFIGVALTLLLLISLVATPELVQAKPKKPPFPVKGNPQMYIIPTSDPAKADQVIQQLKQGESPQSLGLIPAQKNELKQKTIQQFEVEAKKSTATYPVKLNTATPTADPGDDWVPPPFNYDNVQLDECREHEKDNKENTGWIKNHYAYCYSKYIVYSDPAGCGPSPFPFFCDWVSFRFTLLGFGSNGMRTVSYTYYIDDIDMDLDSQNFIGSRVSVDLICQGTSSERDCRGNDSADTRTLAKWRVDDSGTEFFDSEAPPITAGNKDQISYMEIFPRITVDPPGKLPPISSDGAKESIRADSADYLFVFAPRFHPKEGAIFANVKPTFYYDMNDPYFSWLKPAFQHHKDALMSPGSLVPGYNDGRPPLTRLYPNYDPAQKRENDNAKERVCRELRATLPYDPSERNEECDEFPFATTYEGVGRGDGRYSVRYIPRSANNTHGRWLGAWYAYDRILHKDEFFIGFHE